MNAVTNPVVTSTKNIEDSAMTLVDCAEKLIAATDVMQKRSLLGQMKEQIKRSIEQIAEIESDIQKEFNAHVISEATAQAKAMDLTLSGLIEILRPESTNASSAENPPAKAAASKTPKPRGQQPKDDNGKDLKPNPKCHVHKKLANGNHNNFQYGYSDPNKTGKKPEWMKPFLKDGKLDESRFRDATAAETAEMERLKKEEQAAYFPRGKGQASPK